MTDLFILLGMWGFIPCLLAGYYFGKRNGAGVAGLILGAIFGPLGVMLAVANTGDRVTCPRCLEYKRAKAVVCPFCGYGPRTSVVVDQPSPQRAAPVVDRRTPGGRIIAD